MGVSTPSSFFDMAHLDDSTYERLEKYILQKLSNEDKLEFEQQMRNNPQLTQAYLVEKDIRDSIQFTSQEQLRERLHVIHQEFKQTQTQQTSKVKQLNPKRWRYLVAAGLMGVVAGLFLLFQNIGEQDLVADYYKKPSFDQIRGESTFKEARGAYQVGEYQKTLDLLSEQNDPSSQFYKGICFYELEEYTKAADIFQSLLSNEEMNDSAAWYLALSQIKQGKPNDAKLTLDKIIQESIEASSNLKTKAKELKEKLN